MDLKIPSTPFSTRLSGSARETELRIRNIFQWKKKRPPVVLFVLTAAIVLACFGLVSCEVAEEPPLEDTPVAEKPSAVEGTPAADTEETRTPTTVDRQLQLIADALDIWALPAEYANECYAYCVTDLDGNGRLELIAANYGGTGHYTYTCFYEVNEDGTALLPCEYITGFEHDGGSEADVIQHTVDAYRSPLTDLTWYIFEDYGKWGVAEYPEVKLALQLNQGKVETTALGWKHSFFTEDGILDYTSYTDWGGTGWSDAEAEEAQTLYDTVDERYFADLQKLSVTLEWLELSPEEIRGKERDELYSLLMASILGFTTVEVKSAPEPEAETETDVHTRENLNLDGKGDNDDSLTVTVVRPPEWDGGYVTVTVQLGIGQKLEYEVAKGRYVCNAIFTPYLSSDERQTVVLELAIWGANWPASNDFLLEVQDGAVTEVFALNDVLYGLEVIDREDSSLQALRIPTGAGKWHGPEMGTLTWESGQWKFVLDGYYIDDWYTLAVDGGMELTLSLRGRHGGDYYWYYDQIQILHGDTVLQTITEDSFTPEGHCPFEYFNAEVAFHQVDVRDINFDGNTDFGIPCNTTHNDGHCWFIYNPRTRLYEFAFTMAGIPVIDEETQRITEEWWDDSVYITYNTYEYDDAGKLTLIDSRKE